MVLFDPIIFELQGGGGITVYFKNILSRINESYGDSLILDVSRKRIFKRYRDCEVNVDKGVFHSSYYRLPKNRKIKVVTTVHDFTYEKYITGPKRWVHCWQKYRAIRNSDIVICVSNNTAKDLMSYCPIDPDKIRVIHNGVSDSYHPLPMSKSPTKEVLFVGSRVGYKNFYLAIDTLAKLPGYSLSIVGGGALSEEEKTYLDSLIPGRYKWLGRLSDKELNLAYNRAHALLYPSSYEGFGIPVIEAMRAGCPVVAVNCSSIPEVAGDAAILIENADADLFTEALLKVSNTREELINAGLEQAAKFSWDKCFQETLQVYEELM
uniref:D-inositol 3-phosphate glycosyltransferase n=1 Tax=Vibrio parahaemolyticus TaxID=670 RepID=A0A7M1WMG7_VIBPH|nr:D-inositol 3-phosphate glycosyltransferase [Vibrio parahaemolyticus]